MPGDRRGGRNEMRDAQAAAAARDASDRWWAKFNRWLAIIVLPPLVLLLAWAAFDNIVFMERVEARVTGIEEGCGFTRVSTGRHRHYHDDGPYPCDVALRMREAGTDAGGELRTVRTVTFVYRSPADGLDHIVAHPDFRDMFAAAVVGGTIIVRAHIFEAERWQRAD